MTCINFHVAIADKGTVLLHRPTSPSGKMTALSRRLTNPGSSNLPVGTPPGLDRNSTLSRKVKSELNLMDLRHTDYALPTSKAVTPDTSRASESVPGEATPGSSPLVEEAIKDDAVIALKELGILVARRKGLDVSQFVNGLMASLALGHAVKLDTKSGVNHVELQNLTTKEHDNVPADDVTPRPPLRKSQSQSQQRPDQKRRRHFSFEPGDDQVREPEVGLKSYDSLSQTDSTDSESSSAAAFRMFAEDLHSDDDSIPLLTSLSTDFPKPSLIPSPVQTLGRVRRENSMSSLQSIFVRGVQEDDRHNSRTSIQTAFREASSANASIKSKSRSSSNHNLRTVESPLGSKERLNSLANRHSTTALAAARAAEARSSSMSWSNARLSRATSSSRKLRTAGHQKFENANPNARNGVGKGDAE